MKIFCDSLGPTNEWAFYYVVPRYANESHQLLVSRVGHEQAGHSIWAGILTGEVCFFNSLADIVRNLFVIYEIALKCSLIFVEVGQCFRSKMLVLVIWFHRNFCIFDLYDFLCYGVFLYDEVAQNYFLYISYISKRRILLQFTLFVFILTGQVLLCLESNFVFSGCRDDVFDFFPTHRIWRRKGEPRGSSGERLCRERGGVRRWRTARLPTRRGWREPPCQRGENRALSPRGVHGGTFHETPRWW